MGSQLSTGGGDALAQANEPPLTPQRKAESHLLGRVNRCIESAHGLERPHEDGLFVPSRNDDRNEVWKWHGVLRGPIYQCSTGTILSDAAPQQRQNTAVRMFKKPCAVNDRIGVEAAVPAARGGKHGAGRCEHPAAGNFPAPCARGTRAPTPRRVGALLAPGISGRGRMAEQAGSRIRSRTTSETHGFRVKTPVDYTGWTG